MITFSCRCSHKFTVPDDQAGESLQCPACGLLVDVPTIDDLPGLKEDGSYEFNAPRTYSTKPPRPNPLRDTPSVTSRGDSTDRRMSLKDFLAIGTTEEDLLEIRDEVRPGVPKHPKYDPVTGELLIPIEVKRDPTPPPVMAIPVTLGYERKKPDAGQPTLFSPFVWMFRLPNMVVCGIVTALCVATAVMTAVGSFMWLLLILVLPLIMLLIAHFANVVDETGPTGTDEMPPPMRSGHLYDDFFRPLIQVFSAYLIANAPLILLHLYGSNLKLPWTVDLGITLFMNLVIPAILITMITGGALNNLLPSRIFSVITASGWHYWVTTAVGYVAMTAAGVALTFCMISGFTVLHLIFTGPLSTFGPSFGIPPGLVLLITPIITFAAMYLVHVYAWQMGLIYRLHHEKFSWVWQKHTKSERTDNQAQLHQHRQRILEQQAARARKAMEDRTAAQSAVPQAAHPVQASGGPAQRGPGRPAQQAARPAAQRPKSKSVWTDV